MDTMRAPLVAIAISACGRIGFDPTSSGGGGPDGGDGGTGALLISATPLGPSAGFSFVDLEVDWTRSLAYVATRESGQCFEVIDFSATPDVIARYGPPMTSGSPCLGVWLEPTTTRLVVTSEGANVIERWDLGVDPRAGMYTRLAAIGMTGPRRIAPSLTNPATLYVGRNSLSPGVQFVTISPSAPWLSLGPSFDSTLTCAQSVDSTVDLGTGVVLSACADSNAPVEVADDLAMSKLGEIAAAPPSGDSGFWTAAANANGTLGAALGWVGVIVDAHGPGAYAMLARFQLNGSDAYRDSHFIDQSVIGLRDSGAIDRLSLAVPTDPVVVATGSLGTAGTGAYAIEVSPDHARAVVVTNKGYFLVVDLAGLQPTTMRWAAF
jgi:hypothetical protein